jgi:cytoskeletal protein RodZ
VARGALRLDPGDWRPGVAADRSSVRPFGMARAVSIAVQEKPPPVDADATEQLERPPAGTNVAPPPAAAVRRPADRWSTVFTVFAAVALVALLLLGAAVIASQQVAAPSASPSPSASSSPSSSPSASVTVAPRTPTPTEAQPSPTPVPTATAALTPVPTVVPSVPLSPPPLPTPTR